MRNGYIFKPRGRPSMKRDAAISNAYAEQIRRERAEREKTTVDAPVQIRAKVPA